MTDIPLFHALNVLERQQGCRYLILAASQLDMHLLPELYDELQGVGRVDRLNVLLHCRGGEVNAARRVALLLREFAKEVNFVVPYWCESASTLLSLSGDHIYYLPTAIFTPIDPHLLGADQSGEATSLSALDIREFGNMSEQWFGVASDTARTEALSLLCASVFPPTLTAFYRTTKEVRQIASQLLAFQQSANAEDERSKVVEQLMCGFHSHGYALTGPELEALGVSAGPLRDGGAEVWALSRQLQNYVGGHLRTSPEQPWCDALIATTQGTRTRRRSAEGLSGTWHRHGAD
jgi:hypothetical protein